MYPAPPVTSTRIASLREPPWTARERRHYHAGVFFEILKTLETLRAAVGLATPLLVVAVLLRKRMRVSVLLAIAAIAVPFVLASPMVANSLEREVEHSVRDTTKQGVENDVAIVLRGKPEERLGPAVDLLRSGRAGLLLYSGMSDPGEAR